MFRPISSHHLFLGVVVSSVVWLGAVVSYGQTTLDDATILALFDQANSADIETGRLGVERAQSKDVKSLANGVASDHQVVRRMGRDLTKTLGLVPTLPPTNPALAEHTESLAMLRAEPDASFDCAYLTHEIAFHTAVIDAMKNTLIPSARDPKVRGLLKKVLPGFEHHLMATRSLAARRHATCAGA
jgi:putative membrane protein